MPDTPPDPDSPNQRLAGSGPEHMSSREPGAGREISRFEIYPFNIYLNRLPDLDSAISLEENRLSFTFKKKDLERARSLQSRVMQMLSGEMLKVMDEARRSGYRADGSSIRAQGRDKPESNPDNEPKSQSNSGGLENMLRNNDRQNR